MPTLAFFARAALSGAEGVGHDAADGLRDLIPIYRDLPQTYVRGIVCPLRGSGIGGGCSPQEHRIFPQPPM